MKYNQTEKFKALKAKWYEKLKKSGFKDAEKDELTLKKWHSFYKEINRDNTFTQAKSEYYTQVRSFLENGEFKYKYHKEIFSLHVDGLGYRRIAKKFKTNKNKIMYLIRDYLKVMRAR